MRSFAPVPVVLLLALIAGFAVGCGGETSRPIRVEGRLLTMQNDSRDEWRDVEIWVNDHYRVVVPSVAAGQRYAVPLDSFVAGFGQRFNWRRQPVFGVEITGKLPGGGEVTRIWGKGRRR